MESETTTVAAAVIEYRGKYLLMKRAPHKGNGGMWEFPGGKVDPGESLQQAVEREIKEELGLKATTGKVLGSAETKDQDRVLRLFGIETFIEHEPKELKDHSEFLWVHPEEFSRFPMTPAEYGLLSSLKNVLIVEREVANLNVLSFAQFFGLVYGVAGIFAAAFILISSMALPGVINSTLRTVVVIMIPVMNTLAGAFIGAFIAFVYNLYASVFGGIKVRIK